MLNTMKFIGISLAIFITVSLLLVLWQAPLVRAAISQFSPATCYTTAASSTPTIITVGAATSTLQCDMNIEGGKQATLLVNFAASSTNAVLRVDLEYSQNGLDWFQDTVIVATSTDYRGNLNNRTFFTWTFASSTVGQQTPASGLICFAGQATRGDCSTRAINIPTPTRYIRAVFTATGDTAAIWAQILPRVDIN